MILFLQISILEVRNHTSLWVTPKIHVLLYVKVYSFFHGIVPQKPIPRSTFFHKLKTFFFKASIILEIENKFVERRNLTTVYGYTKIYIPISSDFLIATSTKSYSFLGRLVPQDRLLQKVQQKVKSGEGSRSPDSFFPLFFHSRLRLSSFIEASFQRTWKH